MSEINIDIKGDGAGFRGEAEKAVAELNAIAAAADKTSKRAQAANKWRSEAARLAREERKAAFERLPVEERMTRLMERKAVLQARIARYKDNEVRLAALGLQYQRNELALQSLRGQRRRPGLGGIVEKLTGIGELAGPLAGFVAARQAMLALQAVGRDAVAVKTGASAAGITTEEFQRRRFKDETGQDLSNDRALMRPQDIAMMSEATARFREFFGVLKSVVLPALAGGLKLVSMTPNVAGGQFVLERYRDAQDWIREKLGRSSRQDELDIEEGNLRTKAMEQRLEEAKAKRAADEAKKAEAVKEAARLGVSPADANVDSMRRLGMFVGATPTEDGSVRRIAARVLPSLDQRLANIERTMQSFMR